ncbi:hypothetical protein EVAR_71683_1 [Eumeta japonica]|uniref:Uncharacterized protein n=1 Tax=Eumeta variegata TaxID=151549 RepID=A0A4C1TBG5_EUMVA|nr:hypothetical protein EVAR_71683_1 [Eumeta japonica]
MAFEYLGYSLSTQEQQSSLSVGNSGSACAGCSPGGQVWYWCNTLTFCLRGIEARTAAVSTATKTSEERKLTRLSVRLLFEPESKVESVPRGWGLARMIYGKISSNRG